MSPCQPYAYQRVSHDLPVFTGVCCLITLITIHLGTFCLVVTPRISLGVLSVSSIFIRLLCIKHLSNSKSWALIKGGLNVESFTCGSHLKLEQNALENSMAEISQLKNLSHYVRLSRKKATHNGNQLEIFLLKLHTSCQSPCFIFIANALMNHRSLNNNGALHLDSLASDALP